MDMYVPDAGVICVFGVNCPFKVTDVGSVSLSPGAGFPSRCEKSASSPEVPAAPVEVLRCEISHLTIVS